MNPIARRRTQCAAVVAGAGVIGAECDAGGSAELDGEVCAGGGGAVGAAALAGAAGAEAPGCAFWSLSL